VKDSGTSYRFNTLAVHAGQAPDPTTMARAVPVHRTASYVFRDAKHAADLFALREPGNIYTRLMNPTTDVVEQRVTLLERGVGGLGFASGTSAIFSALINIMAQGDELVSASNLYGGTYTMFNDIFPHFGITVRFANHTKPETFHSALTDKTRAIFVESIGNPLLGVPDFDSIADVARSAHVPLIVDSTFTTPYLFRPLEHGANIVVHSLTKWIGGHGTAVGGIVVDGS
jgi:O-acetylhomoserine (thiol)-lyase